ncbi:NAD(P)H-dependent oxidoreductase [Clostridium sp. D2Q-14]|uniref:NAD(P)H-dependent oxidoreductase n=1 Tax=Anaeromonas gelatinilytica TaxID=2683194 RepID=UPI00193C5FD1|nr:NAD(P)H-dependent oxidoreductase [Anaeromonas gelatinilytica]MBS4535313.1 NAD(P)H-dependent oxidoreductase [Anaeromonas gelatinilytica]
MNNTRKVILLIGSPRGVYSTSSVLGNYILKKLEEQNFKTEVLHIHSQLKSQSKREQLLDKIENVDLILLAFPLYVDTLPAPVIRTFELIAENISEKQQERTQKLIAIVNCGFPEASHNRYALATCEQFALETGMQWIGGLSLGMGGAISGKSLDKLGGMVTNVKKSLDLVSESIIKDEKISEKAIEYMAKPLLPSKWLYTFMGSISWRIQALKNKAYSKLNDTPFI